MAGTKRQEAAVDLGAGSQPFSKLARKIVLLVGEDSFVLSHSRALLAVLGELAREVVVVTRSSGRLDELDEIGASVIDFDCRASLSNPARDAAAAWKLARILEAEDADAIHVIGVRPAALGSLALKLVAANHVMVHLPDLDRLEPATSIWPGSIGRLRSGSLHRWCAGPRRSCSWKIPTTSRTCARSASIRVRASPCWAAPASIPTSTPCCRRRRARRRSRRVSAAWWHRAASTF